MSPDFVKVHRSVSGHVAALVYSESNSQAATRGPGAVLGSPFLPQAPPSAKWVDQRRKANKKTLLHQQVFSNIGCITNHNTHANTCKGGSQTQSRIEK